MTDPEKKALAIIDDDNVAKAGRLYGRLGLILSGRGPDNKVRRKTWREGAKRARRMLEAHFGEAGVRLSTSEYLRTSGEAYGRPSFVHRDFFTVRKPEGLGGRKSSDTGMGLNLINSALPILYIPLDKSGEPLSVFYDTVRQKDGLVKAVDTLLSLQEGRPLAKGDSVATKAIKDVAYRLDALKNMKRQLQESLKLVDSEIRRFEAVGRR